MLEKENKEAKISSPIYVDQFGQIIDAFESLIKMLSVTDFTANQKAELCGKTMKLALNMMTLNEKLKEWGFVK